MTILITTSSSTAKVCDSKPVRADYLNQVVWDNVTHLIADPALIRAEIGKRLAQIRTADPATAQRKRRAGPVAQVQWHRPGQEEIP